MKRLLLVAAGLALAGCATEPSGGLLDLMYGSTPAEADRTAARLASHPLGSAANPVRVHMPEGQRAYLARLRCSDGRAPAFQRIGNTGLGPYGSIVDAYEVTCADAKPARSEIHLDMYHPQHVETAAPPGFTIVP